MGNKIMRKAAVSVIIYPPSADREPEAWPPVIVCGPDEDDCPRQEEGGRQIIELVYDHLRVVGLLVEGDGQKIIRVEVYEEMDHAPEQADTQGRPTLK